MKVGFYDFMFDGSYLSDWGMTVGYIVNSVEDSYTFTGEKDLTTVKVKDKEAFVSSSAEPLTFNFDIIKSKCLNADETLSEDFINLLLAWLDTDQYKYFKPIYDGRGMYPEVHFYGMFTNISIIKIGEAIVGLSVNFKADSNHGYYDNRHYEKTLTADDNTLVINNETNRSGINYYNKVTFTCGADGNILLSNSRDGKIRTVINNCVEGEVITIYGKTKIIESNKTHEKLHNDFNFNFPRNVTTRKDILREAMPLMTDIDDDAVYDSNTYTLDTSAMSSCKITVDYEPYRKVGFFV